MNKLVIIGNGFDLAHGLPTSYKDFILWYLKSQILKPDNDLVKFPEFNDRKKIYSLVDNVDNLDSFIIIFNEYGFKIEYKFEFFEHICKKSNKTWVDIENEYFLFLKGMCDNANEIINSSNNKVRRTEHLNLNRHSVSSLNKCLDLIKDKLANYLISLQENSNEVIVNENILAHFSNEIIERNTSNVYILNFNYTDITLKYVQRLNSGRIRLNYIHGKLNNPDNPLIFGYGDETDSYYEKIENLNDNEFTRHFKTFSYLNTDNYLNLFSFLNEDSFEVHIMGHSCGISDRVLFSNVFKHNKFRKIVLYYYQYGEKDCENDFFQKTQELSRHFDISSKHIMRSKVVPFAKSKPLTPYKPKP